MNLDALKSSPRLLIEAKLKPLAGTRFQPTGFPDLGAAQYKSADNVEMVLVESAQSMANRLENVCWDSVNNDWIKSLQGLPLVDVVDKDEKPLTNSVLEAHRLNSIYIKRAEGGKMHLQLKSEMVPNEDRPIDLKLMAKTLLKYDVNSLIHGVFLETIDGRLRLPRALTAFIEADNAKVASSGGVKNDRLDADKSIKLPTAIKGVGTDGDEGRQGNVPFHREEFTGNITGFFVLDLALIRGFGLGADVENLLTAISLYKVHRFLNEGLRLRTACDLEVEGELVVKKPATGFAVPSLEEIEAALPDLIKKVSATKAFAEPVKTTVKFEA
jgi:CRISPR-associated protein Csb1